MSRHELLGGLIQIYRRTGRYWHCSASIDGRQYRITTGEERPFPRQAVCGRLVHWASREGAGRAAGE